MVIRIRQNKRPIPSRQEMRTMASGVRNRLTMRHAVQREENALYISKDPTDAHVGLAYKVMTGLSWNIHNSRVS